MKVKKFDFKKDSLQEIKEMDTKKIKYGTNWPVVYILNNKNKAYIGETLNVYRRMNEHLNDSRRKEFEDINIIFDDEFNKSAILDIESLLIKYMSADKKLDNRNDGLLDYDYYERSKYLAKFEPLWNVLKNHGLVKGRLIDIQNSDFFTYSPYKVLTPDQLLNVDLILRELKDAIKKDEEVTFIVNGSAGTGKTILATYLMKLLRTPNEVRFGESEEDIDSDRQFFESIDGLRVALVIPQQSLRKTLKKVFKNITGLRAMDVIGPYDVPKKEFDLLIVDEAHRLQRPINLGQAHNAYYNNIKLMGLDDSSTELDWIMHQSKYQILFYDEDQMVRPTDIRPKTFYELLDNRKIIPLKLETQMRVKAGEDYIEYIKEIFECCADERKTFSNYEFKLFGNLSKMIKEIKKKEKEVGYSRLVAGYAWDWKSKEDKTGIVYDIEIDKEKLRWNHTYIDWINSPNSINEVGCIHTVQGYDLNYCGVIIGPEIDYDKEKNKMVIDKSKYKDTAGKTKLESDKELKRYIINIYKVLLTRGIEGTYVYVCNDHLREYLKKYI